ncbi:lppC lipofamily protein, partial [Escherichia coli 8.2524]
RRKISPLSQWRLR